MTQTQNQYLDQLFDQIDATESAGGSYNRLLDGTHELIVSNFTATQSKQGLGTILGIEFIVEKSSVHAPGDKRSWALLPNKQGFAAKHESDRIKSFYTTVDASVGIAPRASKETGASLIRGDFRGVLIKAYVTPALKDGKRVLDKKGREVSNIEFSFLGQQSPADIAARAAKCPVTIARQAPVPQAQFAPAPQYPAQPQYQQPQQFAPQAQQFVPQTVGYPPGMQPAQPQQPAQPAGTPGFLSDLTGVRR